jgi:hypothetical protein
LQVGIIDTGISLGHEDLRRNVNKKCEDFVNGDHTCDEGKIKGPSKGARYSAAAKCSLHVVWGMPVHTGWPLQITTLVYLAAGAPVLPRPLPASLMQCRRHTPGAPKSMQYPAFQASGP